MSIQSQLPSRYAPLFRRRAGLLTLLLALNETWRQRHALSGLEPHRLDDIGVTRKMADLEGNRPFWDIPSHWRG